MESDREKGGEMTGMVARVVISFFCLKLVRSMRKANMYPTKVEMVAVRTPSLREPHRATK
ncbi:hypothetical protein SDC9_44666 [bioreactor metagenome]|uniref:Uncharacterized protein n=1 Tax=bioreactor metagenome TaxID=1076179 RepID=A0A644W427_9ZZZZ